MKTSPTGCRTTTFLVLAFWPAGLAFAQPDWTSSGSTDWHTGSNWQGGIVPGTGSFPTFSALSVVDATITQDVTVRGLRSINQSHAINGSGGTFTIDSFTTAGAYSIDVTGASSLTINRNLTTANTPQSITARVLVGSGSTFTFAAGNTWTSDHGIEFNGLDPVAGGTFNFNGALVLGANFFQAGFAPFGPGSTGVLNFNPTSVSATAAGRLQNMGGGMRINLMADFAQGFVMLGNPAFVPPPAAGETYIVTNGMTLSRNVVVTLSNSQGAGLSTTHRFGTDIAGTGTATHTGNFTLGAASLQATYAIDLFTGADDAFTMSGVINGGTTTAGVNQTLRKTGTGTLRIEGGAHNTWVGSPFHIMAGTVILNKSAAGLDAIPNVATTVNNATLRLGRSNQINNNADVDLFSATFDTGGFSETFDLLSITSTSQIDFGAGASILTASRFSGSVSQLFIHNWSGLLTGGGTDQFRVLDTTGVIPYLPNITFQGFLPGATIVNGNEIVPIGLVPEPGTLATAFASAAALIAVGLRSRRRTA